MKLFQVGVGSGGILVLDFLLRETSLTHLMLVDPDVYKPHNVYRHLFPASSLGRKKVDLAAEWVRDHRPDVVVEAIAGDLLIETEAITHAIEACDLGICAVDQERAKYQFDLLFRRARKPWTLGEVLSGGIGGWAHRFTPDGPCYGCVASFLQREVKEEETPRAPDYTNPAPQHEEESIPASKASIAAIAALQANATRELLESPTVATPMNVLLSLKAIPGVFETAYRTYRFTIPRSPTCLLCSERSPPPTGDSLDEALDHALARLGG